MSYGVKFFSTVQLKQIAENETFSKEVQELARLTLHCYELHQTLENLLITSLPTKENN